MSHNNPNERIKQLVSLLQEANQQYYGQGLSPMDDAEYDALLRELSILEQEYPQWVQADSPTRKVGSDLAPASNDFLRVDHRIPMLSIGNAYSRVELQDFDRQLAAIAPQGRRYVAEQKIDGVSLSLCYQNGILLRAVTRGDGSQGDDITTNAKTIADIPQRLPVEHAGLVEVRGEVYMERVGFDQWNESLRAQGKRTFQNPRNTVAGSLKLKDPLEAAARPLRFFAYHIPLEQATGTQSGNLSQLANWGFATSAYTVCRKTLQYCC